MPKEQPTTNLSILEKTSAFWSLIGALVILGTLLCGVALGEIQAKYPMINVTIVFAILTLTIVIALYIYSRFIRNSLIHHLAQTIDRLDRIELIMSRHQAGIDQDGDTMLSQLEFIGFEQTFDGNEIWVISSTLENDDPGTGVYHAVVSSNLARGIKYRYFFPRTPITLGRVSRMQQALHKWRDRLYWHDLPEDIFRLHVGKNMGVYRNTATGVSDLSFVEIKFDKTVRWAKVDEALTLDLVGWVTQYIDESSKAGNAS